jgi:HlyD family secretion protein
LALAIGGTGSPAGQFMRRAGQKKVSRIRFANAKVIVVNPEEKTRDKTMKKKAILFLSILLVLVGTWFAYQQTHNQRSKDLIIYGNIDIRQVNLAFRVAGRIQEMRVEEGDAVNAGDIIAFLDPGPYQDLVNIARAQFEQAHANFTKIVNGYRREEIDQARAQVAQMNANLTNAELNFKREHDLNQSNVISKQELDNAIAQRDTYQAQLEFAEANLALELAGNRREDIDAARSQMEFAKANLESAELNLSDCQLVAPSAGIVITRALEPGAIVSAGLTAYSVALNSPIWARTYIDEPELGRIYPGMKAFVYTDANPKKPYEGQIGFISPVAEFTPKEVQTRELRTDLVFRLRVIIEKPDRYLRQGMPVTIKLVEESNYNALSAIPR